MITVVLWLLFIMTAGHPHPGAMTFLSEKDCIDARAVLLTDTDGLALVSKCERTEVLMAKPYAH